MNLRVLCAAFVLGALGACATADKSATAASTEETTSAPLDEETLAQGRELTRLFYEREIDALWERMDAQMVATLGSKEALAQFREQVDAQLGTETGMLAEQTTMTGAHKVYLRRATFSKFGSPVLVQWALEPEGKISGFFITPAR